MKSLQGQLLIASMDLLDPNFVKTVVLMVQHNQQGALGLVLNRPTQTTIKQALEQVSESSCPRTDVLCLGGPCHGSLMAVHTQEFLKEIEVLPHVYFSAEADNLQRLIELKDEPARFFVGFSGWGPGQLENELKTGSWRTAPATHDSIFSTTEDLWLRVTRQLAKQVLLSAVRARHVPEDPSVN